MKKFIIFIIQKLLQQNPLFFIKFKKIIRYPGEHLYKTLKVIQLFQIKHPHSQDKSHIIIDIGAHNGDTCLFWNKFFPDIKIIGFEPNKEMIQVAKKSCEKNKNIIIYNIGIGAKKHIAKLYLTNNIASSSIIFPYSKHQLFKIQKEYEVEIIPLDEVSEVQSTDIVLLIKIDVQGYEQQVLIGSQKTLSKTAVVLIEMSNHSIYQSPNYFNVDNLLRDNGFELYDIIPGLYGYDLINADDLEKNQLLEWDAIYINKKLFDK